jgi:hypothetical protein
MGLFSFLGNVVKVAAIVGTGGLAIGVLAEAGFDDDDDC